MRDMYKSKKQLIKELEDMRRKASQGNKGTIEGNPARVNAEPVSDAPNYRHDREALLLISRAIDSATDAIVLSDSEGHHVYQNKAFTNLFAYTAEELAAMGNEAVFAVKSAAREVFGSIMSGRSWSGEVEMISKSGHVFGLFLRADAIKDDSGRIVGLVGVFTDIAERKRMEYQLRKKHDELQLILDSIPAYVFYKDKDGKMLNINKAATALAYVPKEKLLQKTVFDLMPATADKYNRDDMEVIRSGQPKINIEESLELPSGTKWLKTDKLPIKDDDGNIVGLLGFSVDITDRKKAQDELSEKEFLLHSFFNSPGLVCGVVELEADDIRFVTVNAAMSEMYGLTPEAVSNKLASEIGTDRGIVELFIENYKKSRESNAPAYFEYRRGVGQETRWFYVTATFLGLEPTSLKPRYAFITTDITDRRRAEEALRASEEKYRGIFDESIAAIYIFDAKKNFIHTNQAGSDLLGYSREELLRMSIPDVDADPVVVLPAHQDLLAGGRLINYEHKLRRKDGTIVIVLNNSRPLTDIQGNIVGMLSTLIDITERKKADEALRNSEEKLRVMFESMTDAIVLTDLNGTVLDINVSALETFGNSKDEVIGRNGLDVVAFEDRERAVRNLANSMYGTEITGIQEYRILDKNDRVINTEINVNRLADFTGKPYGFIVVVRDVTARKAVEEALRESEAKYRFLTERMNDIIWTVDMGFRSTYVSPSITRILGYTPEERVGQPGQNYVTQESFKRCIEALTYELERDGQEGIDPDRSIQLEIEYYHKDGSTVWMEDVVAAIRDDKGSPIGLHGVSRDISERRKAEKALHESEQKLRLMFESIKDGIFIVDLDGKVTEANASVEKMTGYSREQVIGQGGLDYMFPGFKGNAFGMLQKAVARGGTQKEVIVPIKAADGRIIEVEANSSVLRDKSGEPIGLIGTVRDVSERKRMEDALRDSEEKLRLIFASMADGVVVTDTEGKIIDINETQLRMFGFKEKSELIDKGGFDFLAERERGRALADMFKVYEKGFNTGSIYTVVDKNGREFECELSTAMLHDVTGKPNGTVTVMRDVTERRRMEQRIRESEERYRLLAENVSDVLWIMDLDLKYLYVSPSIERMRGFTPDEYLGMTAWDNVSKESLDIAVKRLAAELELEKTSGADLDRVTTIELEVKGKDGSWMWTEAKINFIRDNDGKPIGLLGITRDINERRKAQEALRETNEKLQVIFDSIGEAVTVVDLSGNIVDANKEALRLHGFDSKDGIIGRKSSELVAILDRERAVKDAVKSLNPPYLSGRSEYKLVNTSGREFDGEFTVAVIRDSKGKPSGFIGVARDISERKRAEAEIIVLSNAFRAALDAVLIFDMQGNLVNANDAAHKLFERNDIGVNALESVAPEDKERVALVLQDLIISGHPSVAQFSIVTKSGRRVPLEASGNLIQDTGGKPVGIVVVERDLTERRQAEEALRESEEKYREVVERANDGIIIIQDEIIQYANQRVMDIAGVKPEEAIGTSMIKYIHPSELTKVLTLYKRRMAGEDIPATYETAFVHKDGHRVNVELNAGIIRYREEPADLVIIRDISERKKAEEALQARERYFRAITDLSSGAALLLNLEGKILDVTGGLERISGYTQESTIGSSAIEFIHPEELQKAGVAFDESIRNPGKTVTLEARLKNARGKWQWTECMLTNLLEQQDVRGIVNHLVDITERKKTEQALSQSEKKYRQLIETLQEGIWSIDKEANTTFVNPRMAEMLGYTPEEMQGKHLFSFMDERGVEIAQRNLERRRKGITEQHDFEFVRKDGSRIYTTLETGPIIDEKGEYIGALAGVQDITQRKHAEEDVKSHAKRVEALYGVAQVISQSSTLDAMLKDTLAKVCAAMDTESGCIFMLDLNENALELKACRGVPENIKQQFKIIGLTEQGMETIVNLTGPVTDIDEAQNVIESEKMKKVTADIGRKGLAAAPFFRGNDLQGLVVTFTTKDRRFSGEDLELLKALADEISIGINNIMLMEKTREMSVTDELTGLYNRRYFFEMLDVEMNRAGRTKHPFSLVMLDLDGFKEYNDKYGHSNGDAVLETFSQILKSSIRKSDIAFRYGGDEFALVLPSASAERAKKIVQRARAKWQKAPLAQTRIFGGHVGFSTGIAEYPENAESADGLIFLADAALYQAKKKGYEDKLVSELRTLSTDIMDVATQDQVYALAATVDARDPYTYGHSQRVAEIAMTIGRQVGLSSEDLAKLHAAALLHDIGKVGVPDAILAKMGRPTSEEWEVIKKHCSEGARIVSYVKELSSLVPIILHHHEWYDGSGYPGGLKGMDIPSGARITTVADAYDTMVTKRPYRDVISPKEACEELKRFAGVQFDPVIVDVWSKMVDQASKKDK